MSDLEDVKDDLERICAEGDVLCCAALKCIRELEATPAPVTVQEVRAALGQLLEQVYQMQGMFPNDEALELAIQDAEDALEL